MYHCAIADIDLRTTSGRYERMTSLEILPNRLNLSKFSVCPSDLAEINRRFCRNYFVQCSRCAVTHTQNWLRCVGATTYNFQLAICRYFSLPVFGIAFKCVLFCGFLVGILRPEYYYYQNCILQRIKRFFCLHTRYIENSNTVKNELCMWWSID